MAVKLLRNPDTGAFKRRTAVGTKFADGNDPACLQECCQACRSLCDDPTVVVFETPCPPNRDPDNWGHRLYFKTPTTVCVTLVTAGCSGSVVNTAKTTVLDWNFPALDLLAVVDAVVVNTSTISSALGERQYTFDELGLPGSTVRALVSGVLTDANTALSKLRLGCHVKEEAGLPTISQFLALVDWVSPDGLVVSLGVMGFGVAGARPVFNAVNSQSVDISEVVYNSLVCDAENDTPLSLTDTDMTTVTGASFTDVANNEVTVVGSVVVSGDVFPAYRCNCIMETGSVGNNVFVREVPGFTTTQTAPWVSQIAVLGNDGVVANSTINSTTVDVGVRVVTEALQVSFFWDKHPPLNAIVVGFECKLKARFRSVSGGGPVATKQARIKRFQIIQNVAFTGVSGLRGQNKANDETLYTFTGVAGESSGFIERTYGADDDDWVVAPGDWTTMLSNIQNDQFGVSCYFALTDSVGNPVALPIGGYDTQFEVDLIGEAKLWYIDPGLPGCTQMARGSCCGG